MKLLAIPLIAAGISSLFSITAPARAAAAASNSQITILYDAFGTDPSMTKDWGFSALVEIAGKRILFDTGNDAEIFAANVKAKGVDLKTLDFVVLSHRHSDHIAGLNYVLSVNPTVKIYAPKEGFGIYGSSLPSSFYRKDENLPPQMRYYGGNPATNHEVWRGLAKGQFRINRQDCRNRSRHNLDSVGIRCSRHERAQGAISCCQHL
jgi:7,8-dihydropterin-6-yl-methyl-4-(beta-D-ribofuranosyl)aminobenzene 5'-phosphate synthase